MHYVNNCFYCTFAVEKNELLKKKEKKKNLNEAFYELSFLKDMPENGMELKLSRVAVHCIDV